MPQLKTLALTRAQELQAPPPPGQVHSITLPGSERPGRTPVYRHWRCKDGLLKTLDPKIVTAHDFFEDVANTVPDNKCLGHRPYDPATKTFGNYVWQTYGEIQKRRRNFGVGLVQLHREIGITGKQYGIGLWCQNRPEWQITDLACQSQALFTVSLYDTLGPDTTEFIINHAELACVVTSLNHVPALLKGKSRLPTLKLIVCMDPLNEGERPGESKGEILNAMATDLGVKIIYIKDVEALGEATPAGYNLPSPDDIATINYTSGTTGNPKGVVLTHANSVAGASSALVTVKQRRPDVGASFLPLAHIYQRNGEHMSLWAGGAIAYFHGNIAELVDDLKLIRPTGFAGVPRLYNKFGAVITNATLDQPGVKGSLARHVVKTKLASINDPKAGLNANKHALYDRIFSHKAAAAFGLDRVETMVSGSAPLDPSLQQFLRTIFPGQIIQGYGLTETYAIGTVQLQGDFSAGNCGAVAVTTEACLEDVPDMEYFATDKPYPRGELLLRGSTLFKEYYKDPAETSKAVDKDGWFHTGDIALFDDMGRVKIIDRKKNVLKLAQGEYISPERIENVYLANLSYLAIAYAHGDSSKSALVGLFGVAPDTFAPFASKVLGRSISAADVEAVREACGEEKVRAAVVRDLERIGKKSKFNSYEKVKRVRLMLEPFTIENELLTPTLKLKRPQAAKKYRDLIDEMYAEIEAAPTAKAKL